MLSSVLISILLATPVQARDWLMPGLSTEWIARDMHLNGVPASIRSVSGRRSLDQVLDYYRRQWAGRIAIRRAGSWRVLAMKSGTQFASLRIRSLGAGVQGVLTVSLDPDRATPTLDSELRIPSGLERLSHQVFNDPGSQGENLTLMSRRSVVFERQAFCALYQTDGWTMLEDRPTSSVRGGHVLTFLRAKEQVRVVLYSDTELAEGRTLILVTAHKD